MRSSPRRERRSSSIYKPDQACFLQPTSYRPPIHKRMNYPQHPIYTKSKVNYFLSVAFLTELVVVCVWSDCSVRIFVIIHLWLYGIKEYEASTKRTKHVRWIDEDRFIFHSQTETNSSLANRIASSVNLHKGVSNNKIEQRKGLLK